VSGPFDVATIRSLPEAERWCFCSVCSHCGKWPVEIKAVSSYVLHFIH